MRIGISLSSTLLEARAVSVNKADIKEVYLNSLKLAEEERKAYGLKVVEVVVQQPIFAYDLMEISKEIKKAASGFEEITLHAPFHEISLASFHPDIRRASIKEYIRNIGLASEIGARKIVIHPGMLMETHKLVEPFVRANVLRAFSSLQSIAVKAGTMLCVENLPINDTMYHKPEEMEGFIDRGAYMTLDTGHGITAGIDPSAFLDRFGPKISHIHLVDDFKGRNDMHIPLGKGDLDVKAAWKRIEGIGNDPSVIVEYPNLKDFKASMDYLVSQGLYSPKEAR